VIILSPCHITLEEGEDSISTNFLTSALYLCELSVSVSGRLTTSSLTLSTYESCTQIFDCPVSIEVTLPN